MKTKIILFVGLLLFNSIEVSAKKRAPYVIGESKISKALKTNQSVIDFTFINLGDDTLQKVRYSIDNGKEASAMLVRGKFSIKTRPGKHSFMILYGTEYAEIFITAVNLKKQHRLDISLYPYVSQVIMTEKPVLYLYPEITTKVKVEVDPKGTLNFTYPVYKDGWNVVAEPNGSLTCNGKQFNYLFWDATQVIEKQEFKEGFLLEKNDVISFLEEKSSAFGLTSKEQADFITYWGPRLVQNDLNLVHFVFNDDCDQFASLKITPKPDQLLRFYIVFRKAEPKTNVPTPQEIPVSNRDGFDVLEWGGVELK
jgi:hypothetical protein